MERELAASLKAANRLSVPLRKKRFCCRADAEQAVQELAAQRLRFHHLEIAIIERPRYGPGRPAQGAERLPVAIDYVLTVRIIEREDVLAKHRESAGCFVLLSNVPVNWGDGYGAEKILRTYKDQYGIENNFGFLKDDQIVNAIFLKRPERIEALGLILLIALLAWRLIEHIMRTVLEAIDTTLSGWDNKPSKRPTSYMMMWKFRGIIVLVQGGKRQLAKPLTATQEAFLAALKIPVGCFTQVIQPN